MAVRIEAIPRQFTRRREETIIVWSSDEVAIRRKDLESSIPRAIGKSGRYYGAIRFIGREGRKRLYRYLHILIGRRHGGTVLRITRSRGSIAA